MAVGSAPDGRPAFQLAGFVVLIAVLFAAAYGIGRLAGRVAPGMHRVAPGTVDRAPQEHGSHDLPGVDVP